MRRQLSPTALLTILTGLNLLNYLDRFVLNAVRTPLANEFNISYGDSGRAFTAFMVGYFITSPFFGYLGDRFSRKRLIAFGIFVWSLGTLFTGFAATFATLLCFRVLVGLGEASYATISPGLISDVFGPLKRNNALTIFYVAIPIGAALGYVLGGEISARWDWHQAFIWAGIPGILLAVVLLPFAEPKRGQSDLQADVVLKKPKLAEFFGLFRNANYQLLIWGYVAYTFAMGAFAFWGPTYFEKVHGMTTAGADKFFGAVLVVAGLVGTLAGGFIATAWQKRNPAGYAWLLCVSVLTSAPFCLLAFLSSSRGGAMTFLAAGIFLLFLSTGPVNTLILETVPVNLRTSAMALSIFMIHLFGDMWSPEIVGRIADALNKDLRRAVMILPAVLFLGGLFWIALAMKLRTVPAKK